MKRFFRTALLSLAVSFTAIAFVGCAASDGLTLFLITAGRGVETAESLDDIDLADVDPALAEGLSATFDEAWTLLAAPLAQTPAEKVEEIVALRAQIRSIHGTIVATRAELRTAFETLRSDVAAFRAADGSLSEEERAIVAARRTEVKALATSLRDTIGMAFERLRALRGKYDREHLDLVLTTHREVLAVLEGRLVDIERTLAILVELDGMVAVPEA